MPFSEVFTLHKLSGQENYRHYACNPKNGVILFWSWFFYFWLFFWRVIEWISTICHCNQRGSFRSAVDHSASVHGNPIA